MNRLPHKLLKWTQAHFEALFWAIALIILFFLPENLSDKSLCVFSLLGLGHCPGCGIGHAIHYALHLKMAVSVHHHPLGIIGVLIIFIRIKQLLYPKKYIHET